MKCHEKKSIITKTVASTLPNSTANANKNTRWQTKQTSTGFKAILEKILFKAPLLVQHWGFSNHQISVQYYFQIY